MKRKILPELVKSVEFGGGGPKVFAVVLQIGAKLSEEEYDMQLVPVLVRLFARQDRAMRVCLLENISLMIDHLSSKIVNDKIFPSLVCHHMFVTVMKRLIMSRFPGLLIKHHCCENRLLNLYSQLFRS